MLKLIIEDDEGRQTVVPFVRDEITIGRQEGNTIRLTERNVSRRHARLLRHDGEVVVEDLGSYNGIRVNGEKIERRVPLTDGDWIQIGDYDLAIQHEGAHQPDSSPIPPQEAGDRVNGWEPHAGAVPDAPKEKSKLPWIIGGSAMVALIAGAGVLLSVSRGKGQPASTQEVPAAPAQTTAPTVANPSQTTEIQADAAPPAPKAAPAEKARSKPRGQVKPASTADDDPAKLFDEGKKLLEKHQTREARATLDKCVEVDPRYAPCHLLLGAAQARLGEVDQGARHYETFLKLAPDAPEAPKVRLMLQQYNDTQKQ